MTILVALGGCGRSDRAPPPQGKSAAPSAARVRFGASSFVLPEGWRETKRQPDLVTFRAADDTEQATVSKLDLAAVPSFEEFKLLTEYRVAAEKRNDQQITLDVESPSNAGPHLTFKYSGSANGGERLFSGYLIVVGATLMTIYVESVGQATERHRASFEDFVSGFRP